MSAIKPMMKPSRTTRLLENEELANKQTKHRRSAAAATNRNSMMTNRLTYWRSKHQYATTVGDEDEQGLATSVVLAKTESVNYSRSILFHSRPEFSEMPRLGGLPATSVNEFVSRPWLAPAG